MDSGEGIHEPAAFAIILPEDVSTHETATRVDQAELNSVENLSILPLFDTIRDDMTGFDVISLS